PCHPAPRAAGPFPTRRSSGLQMPEPAAATRLAAAMSFSPSRRARPASHRNKVAVKPIANAEAERLMLNRALPPVRSIRFFAQNRSEEHTSELQSRENLVCRLL